MSGASGGAQVSAKAIRGVFAPVVTPFREERVDLEALRENLRKLAGSRLTGYLALGSNGEARSLNREEQRRVLEVFAAERADKLVMVGTGAESTALTLEHTREAAGMGFPLASVLTPSYFASRMDSEALETHFRRIADDSPIPILIYNAPGFAAGVEVAPAVVARLAAHPNILGMKDSGKAGPAKYLSALGEREDFSVLAGSTAFFYPSLHIGAAGGVLSLANSLPEACCALWDLHARGRSNEARVLHERLFRLNTASSGRYGVAGVKALMDLRGFQGGAPRLPLKTLTAEQRRTLASALEAEGL